MKYTLNDIGWVGLLVTLFLCLFFSEDKIAVEVVQPIQDTTHIYYNELPEKIHRLWLVKNR